VITSEDELDRLPQTAKMRQDLQDPQRRIALRREYKKEELPGGWLNPASFLSAPQLDTLSRMENQTLEAREPSARGSPRPAAQTIAVWALKVGFSGHRGSVTKFGSMLTQSMQSDERTVGSIWLAIFPPIAS
jgi:hypothetical protein